MNTEQQVAFEWAKNQNFQSVAARYAKTLSTLIDSLQAQLADYHHMSKLVDGKTEENQRLRRINENLQEQLNDVVPVVRCGECDRRIKSADLTNTVLCGWLHKITMNKDDFCSYGAKMEEVEP